MSFFSSCIGVNSLLIIYSDLKSRYQQGEELANYVFNN